MSRATHPTPAQTFPRRGVVAYHTTRGPILAASLGVLDHLRSLPDYESCNPLLSDSELAVDWNFSRARVQRTQPLRIHPAEIAAEWNMWKLQALIRGSQEDKAALVRTADEAQRHVYDADRVIEDLKRADRTYGQGPRLDARGLYINSTRIAGVKSIEIERGWDVYKLREVFSGIQAECEGLVKKIANLHAELREKQWRANQLQAEGAVSSRGAGYGTGRDNEERRSRM